MIGLREGVGMKKHRSGYGNRIPHITEDPSRDSAQVRNRTGRPPSRRCVDNYLLETPDDMSNVWLAGVSFSGCWTCKMICWIV